MAGGDPGTEQEQAQKRPSVRPVHIALALIVLLGLGLRLAWAVHMDTFPLGGDPAWYADVAENVVEGRGYVVDWEAPELHGGDLWAEIYEEGGLDPREQRPPGWEPVEGEATAFWPPVYPLTLAALWTVFGVSITAAKVLNAVLGALTIPFLFALGRRVFSEKVGLAAAGVFAVLPNAIAWTPALLSETLFTFVFVVALWLLVTRGGDSRWAVMAALFGLIVGVATLTRGPGLVLIPLALIFWLMRDGWRPAFARTVVASLVVVAVVAPWTVRNAVVMDSFIPIASSGGVNLRMGHAPYATGTFLWPEDPVDGVPGEWARYRTEWEVEANRVYTRRAMEYALGHPLDELRLAGEKVRYMYESDSRMLPTLTTLGVTPIEPDALEDAATWLLDVSYYVLVFAATLTVPFWLRRDAYRVLPLMLVLLWTAFHVAFFGEARFHVPLLPVFAVVGAGGVWHAVESVLWGWNIVEPEGQRRGILNRLIVRRRPHRLGD